MPTISALDAVKYTLRPELLKLLVIALVGAVVVSYGLFLTAVGTTLGSILGIVAAVAGAVVLYAGVTGIAYKIVTDASGANAGPL